MATVISDVRATVEALAKGLIPESKMPAPSAKARKDSLRYAPSFVSGVPSASLKDAHPYSALSIAKFLGMYKADGRGGMRADRDIETALDALELIEQGALTESATIDPQTHQEVGVDVLRLKIQTKREAIEAAARRQRRARFVVTRS